MTCDVFSDKPSLSILDRLLDDFPEFQNIEMTEELQSVEWKEYCQSLKRDIEMLLASRPMLDIKEAEVGALVASSVAAYGLTGTVNHTPEAILKAVTTFEPRLSRSSRLVQDDGVGNTYSIYAEVEWNNEPRKIILSISEVNDGYAVEIYE